MKKTNMILKIVSAVLCGLTIVPLFLNYITVKNGSASLSRTFAEVAGSSDTLLIISRILFIAMIAVSMVLLVCLVLQFIFKNDILDWVVIGASVFVVIVSALGFVSVLLYCVSVSEFGKIVWYPSVGAYIFLILGLIAPILAMFSNRKLENK